MKRYLSVLIAVLMVAGLATAAGAELTYDGLDIDVDFWTSASDRLGPGDQGGTFEVNVGDEFGIDFYFTSTLNFSALTFDTQYDPLKAQALRKEAVPIQNNKLFSPSSIDLITPGSAKYGTGVIDILAGEPSTATGTDILFARIIFQCIALGDVDLMLANYNGFDVNLPPTDNIVIDPSGYLLTVSQVPIPGTIWLLGAGLAGLVGIRRNRRK